MAPYDRRSILTFSGVSKKKKANQDFASKKKKKIVYNRLFKKKKASQYDSAAKNAFRRHSVFQNKIHEKQNGKTKWKKRMKKKQNKNTKQRGKKEKTNETKKKLFARVLTSLIICRGVLYCLAWDTLPTA